ncbi:hypothetical protein PMG11_00631 [Penicillium brasilianum]|uniref:Uncharacterized protein n=1 Tax=Penicillium brasilianum TaxID=104259 RepID=A0A0F7TH42_PENBI|nr:hypothetical protein PMG11_00631 [Penicillium brasilianum]
MGSTGVLSRPGEHWQQSAAKWQQSTDKWQHSTTEAWRRSATAWHDSKDRCHRTTMEACHKSADSWNYSKIVCRRSTAGVLARSANRIYQTTDRLQHKGLLEHQAEHKKPPTEQSSEPGSPPSGNITHIPEAPQAVQPAESRSLTDTPKSPQPKISTTSPLSQTSPVSSISSPSTSSPKSPSETATDSTASSSLSVDLSIKKRRPDEQIRGLLKFADHVSSRVMEAKRLRDAKSTQLGEIEHNWINSTIVDADDSARELADLLELCRFDMAKRKGKGKISSTNRKQWKLQGRGRAEEKQYRLVRYQCRLDRVLAHLENLKLPLETLAHDTAAEAAAELSTREPGAKSVAELSSDVSPDPVAELPSDVLQESKVPVAELPSSSGTIIRKPVPVLAELPGDSAIICIQPAPIARNIPKIIVTSTPDDSSFTLVDSPDTPNATYESRELNELLSWKETRNSIRLQQSESLSKIVSRMESTRSK